MRWIDIAAGRFDHPLVSIIEGTSNLNISYNRRRSVLNFPYYVKIISIIDIVARTQDSSKLEGWPKVL